MASRNISDLSPAMRPLALDFIASCAADTWLLDKGIVVLIVCTYRNKAEQDALYEQGRSKPGSVVTNARGGQSKHNAVDAEGKPAADALDVVPLQHGKPVWGTKGDDLEIWQHIGAIGKSCGLKWYGDPGAPFREYPHFQNPDA